MLELAVRARHRIRIDDELFGERADRRQLLIRHEHAGGDEVAHLVHDLLVNRQAVIGRNVDLHRVRSCLLVLGH